MTAENSKVLSKISSELVIKAGLSSTVYTYISGQNNKRRTIIIPGCCWQGSGLTHKNIENHI